MARITGLLIALLAAAQAASGQSSSAAASARACDTARLYTTADTVDKMAYATLSASDAQSPGAEFLSRLLDEIAAQLRMPSDLTVLPTSPLLEPVVLSACRGPCTRSGGGGWADVMRARDTPAIEGVATFVLRRARGIDEIRALTDLRADPDIGPVLARTLSLIDRRRLPPFPRELRADTLALRLHVGLALDSTPVRRALFGVRLPLQLEQAVRLETSVARTIRHRAPPGGLLVGDSVVVELIVDASGQPVAGTASIVHARDSRFAESVLEAVPRWRYAPAVVDGCAVKMLVRQPVVLRVE